MRVLVLAFVLAAAPAAAMPCEDLRTLQLPNTEITGAATVAAGAFQTFRSLPEFCRVTATLRPSSDSDIKIEVWLPSTGWNGKFQAVGNGGWAGVIPYPSLAAAVAGGYASAGTDAGHAGNTAAFALGHPEKVIDMGYRAVHEMTVQAKAMIGALYAQPPTLSIWNACSTGGRQGITAAVRYPDDFDGVVAGAPAVNWMHLHAGRIAINQAVNKTRAHAIPREKHAMVHAAVLNACDGLDGVKDGVLESPRACRFDPQVLACTGADGPSCLTAAQVEGARAFYDPIRHPATGEVVMPGLERGAELSWSTLGGAQPIGNAVEAFKYVVHQDAGWDPRRFNLATDVELADTLDGGVLASSDPNLKPFFERGGKLLIYHGWSDPQIPPGNTINYFNRVADTVGREAVGSSMQLFLIPGMNHCRGGAGTDAFDGVGALEQWMAGGQAPAHIVASRVVNGAVERTRPLCPYGQVAAWNGSGNSNDAANFACVAETTATVVDASITGMQQALTEGRVTSRQLVEQSLLRIALYENQLNAAITVNARALDDADARDRERAAGMVRGPLHGIPIALKDNIHTTGMPTTGGALAFAGLVPPYEATVATQLRDAGAIILAKTQMTELANWVTVGMPANYNSLTGFGFNPYDPRRDPRPATADGRPVLATGGSSSGLGTAVSFWAASVGTETSGSILSPANQTMLVGIKPTVGRVSRHGIIPITADQDTAGPMARSVADAALMLGAMESAAPDPNDAATNRCQPPPGRDYTRFLDRGALKGARIGIPRAFFYDRATAPGTTDPRGGLTAEQRAAMDDAIAVLKREGATIVDPADIPSILDPDPDANFLLWNICAGLENARGRDRECSTAFKYGMKRDFNAWLDSLGPAAPVKTLAELRQWNIAHARAGTLKYGQQNLDISDEMEIARDKTRYEADRRKDLLLAGARGLDAALAAHQLDALLFPGSSGAAIAARPGYPSVIVPFALVPNAPAPPFPDGFTAGRAPFGVTFTASACAEPRLIALAYAFEQATRRRMPPALFP